MSIIALTIIITIVFLVLLYIINDQIHKIKELEAALKFYQSAFLSTQKGNMTICPKEEKTNKKANKEDNVIHVNFK